jgi:hypothetical protein
LRAKDCVLHPFNWDCITRNTQVENGEGNEAESECRALTKFPVAAAFNNEGRLLSVGVDFRLEGKAGDQVAEAH